MNNIIYWMAIAALVLLVTGCASSQPEPGVTPSTQTGMVLSPAEKTTYARALKQLHQDEADKAEKALTKLAQSHGGHFGIWLNLANARYQTNNLEPALSALAQAQAINDKAAEVYNLYGLIAVEQRDYKAAEAHYLKALSLNKRYPTAHYNLALIYDVFYQDIANAITHYQHYLALTPEEDPTTASWVEELKLSLKRRSNG